jgi:hypothetical protein
MRAEPGDFPEKKPYLIIPLIDSPRKRKVEEVA